MEAFDRTLLTARLNALNERQQLAFGAIISERLIPNYIMFHQKTGWGDPSLIQSSMNLVWAYLEGQHVDSLQIQTAITSCEKLLPDSENFETLYISFAQDSVCAVCSILDYLLESNVDKIAQVAILATDSVDLYVQEIDALQPNDPELEHKILTHELMQRELAEQQANLKWIEKFPSLNAKLLSKLKSSWSNNGKSNLDLPL